MEKAGSGSTDKRCATKALSDTRNDENWKWI